MRLPRPRDLMRAFLAILLLAAFMASLFALFIWAVPESNRDLVTYMLGQLSGFAGGAFLFYFGTTKSSADKNEIIGRVTDGQNHPSPQSTVLPQPTFGETEK